MATSQNGWPALPDGDRRLYVWTVPTKHGDIRIRLRNGSAGFVLCHLLLWFAEVVERITGGVLDDWGWAWRPVRGQSTGLSNHAAGCAFDVNALRHILGHRGTFARWQQIRIRARLLWLRGVVRWGGNYRTRVDEMHFEIVKPLGDCERLARLLMKTPRGRRILRANPSQRAVILS